MNDTPTTDIVPGFLAFVAFALLAVALWFLMRNMNARMRRMSYRQQQAHRSRDEAQAGPADTRVVAAGAAFGSDDGRPDGERPDGQHPAGHHSGGQHGGHDGGGQHDGHDGGSATGDGGGSGGGDGGSGGSDGGGSGGD
ncbi:hypothetical protein [Phycicoccus duodecadis]|uniref:Uncharacterized protein n=1 Tax=Phycicoccus duodecadis TaxID=173053 RepID=A0A2N3YKN7_9MICO|nr:hypothetical protein [Phycicoccus duodecadis]PKW27423.1 hypothetical protein ATL31_2264 [Phycicoccus duodecadis]